MDSTKNANWPIATAIIMGIPNWLMLALMLWFRWYPDPTKQLGIMPRFDVLTTGWLPIIVVSTSSALSAIALLIVAARRWKNKRLAFEIGQLKPALAEATGEAEKVERLLNEKQGLEEALSRRRDEKIALEEQLGELRADLAKAKAEWEQPDQKMLQLLAKADREEIQEAVVVRGVQFRNEIEYGKRYVDFVFGVHNQSHYEITIDDTLGEGQIIFSKEKLVKGKEIVDNKAQNIPPRSSGDFTVRQYLDSGDIDLIKSAFSDRQFEFHDVKVKIRGGASCKQLIQEKQLRIDCYLSKENPIWINYNGPFRSRFNGELVGTIREVFFQSQFDLDNFSAGQDYAYDLFFVLHVFLVNHGAPTTIERFRLIVMVDGQPYEAERQPLTGFRVTRRGETDFKPLDDVEDLNGVTFSDTRRGWLRFRVSGVKRYEEDKPKLEFELDAIDKNEDSNRLRVVSDSRWLGHATFQGDYILGSDEWADNKRTTNIAEETNQKQ